MFHFRSDLKAVAVVLVSFFAIIIANDSTDSLDSKADLIVVVTDGVNPETGLCAGTRESGDKGQHDHLDFQGLLGEMTALLNDVIKESMKESSSLVLLEMACEDGLDVITETITDLLANNQVTGVVTITLGHVVDRILGILRYWNVPVVEVVSSDVITRDSTGPNHFILPHYKYWQIKHAILAADAFSWTALTISYQEQSSRTFYAIKDLFIRLALKHGICVLPRHLGSDVPTVIFQHEGNVSSTLDRTDTGTVLLVGISAGISEESEYRYEQPVLHLHAQNTDGRHLMKAIEAACNITSADSSGYSDPQHGYKSLCLNASILNMTTLGVKFYLESFFTGVSFLMNTSAVLMDPFPCNKSNVSLECLLLGSREIMLDKSNVLYLSRNIFEVDYLNKNVSKPCGLKNITYDTLIFPECIHSAVFNKSCGNVCDKCMKCFPSIFTDTNIMTSGEGDAIIVAFFPIHMSTEEGFCGKANPEGYLASLTFLETIKSYSSTVNMPGIQGVVFDSCGSLGEVTSVLHSLETCKFYFKEKVGVANVSRSFPESSIIGYVNGLNSFSLPRAMKGKFILHLHDFGYSTGSDFGHTFINNILVALSKIGWTVINVLVSDEEPFRTLSKLLNASPLSNKFCFVNQIVLHADASLREDDLNQTLSCMNQTPAFLLLTNLEDSDLVLENMRRYAQYTTSKASLALTHWNLAYDVDKMLHYVDTIIKFTPGVKNPSKTMLNSLSRTVQSGQSMWSREFSNVSVAALLNSSQLAVVLGATEKLLDSFDVSYNTGAQMGDVNIGPTSLKVSAFSGDGNYETEITYMDTTDTLKASYKGPSFSECKGWCPACQACPVKDTAQTTNLYLDGDILITGVFPLHQTGATAFSCGSPQSDVHKLLTVQSFMFAVETFKMRYPDLLPGLRIGGLVLDSCSSSATALKVIGDFETCTLNFRGSALHSSQDETSSEKITETYNKAANPSTNVAYILDLNGDSIQSLQSTLKTLQLYNSIFMSSVQTSLPQLASFQFIPAIIQILTTLGWDKIIIITGKPSEFQQEVDALISEAYTNNICVVATLQIESVLSQVGSDLELYMGLPVILFSSKEDSEIIFDSLKDIKDSYFWIIPMYHRSWRLVVNKQDYVPLGCIFIDRKSMENEAYKAFVHNLTTEPDFVRSLSSWFHDLWRLRFSCYFPREMFQELDKTQECPIIAPVSDVNITSYEVYNAIVLVDAVLHSMHVKYMDKCPNGYGVCDQVAAEMRNTSWSLRPDVTFDYQGEQLNYTFDGQLAMALSIFSNQKDGVQQIGSYFKPTLTLNITQIRFYSADGSELNTIPRAVCVSACDCLIASPVNGTYFTETHPYFYNTTGEFIDDLWAIIAVAIGGFGALLSLIFAIYVVYKVAKKALGKRFVSLGLTLLFSVALLYMTILPFVFTPSEAVCGLRYVLTGVSYSLCFAVILVKLMSLQSYKLIGLGGEISKTNQFLTTFFIVGVQIAIGVQWWLNNDPTMYSVNDSLNVQKYVCNFNRREFVAYHAYVMLLITICCSYAISVRNEKKNMGEARLLLTCCCSCVVIWAAWLPCLVLLDRKWSDVIICAGILANATAVLLIIFVPKIRMVSRLKYDLSQKTNARNGHSLDTDFLYERPYSLPGTLTSTFSSAKMNYPKTTSSFDADVNY